MPRKRELIEPHQGDKRYIRRGEGGRIKESVDVGRSLAQDRRTEAKTAASRAMATRAIARGEESPKT